MASLVDAIAQHASRNSAAPALIGQQGSVTFGELLDLIVRVSNFLEDRKLPRLACAFLNIRDAELRLIVTIAAIECGLVPAFASPELLRRDFPYSLTIGSRAPMRPDILSDLVIDESVMTGRFADSQRRPPAARAAGDLAYVTEATAATGEPILIGVSQATRQISLVRPANDQLKPDDRIMFAMGSISRRGQTTAERTLAAGAALVSAPNDPVGCLSSMALFEVIELHTTPFAIGKMVSAMEQHNLRTPAVKRIHLAGAAFEPALLGRIEAVFDAGVSVDYVTSELGLVASGIFTAATYRRGAVGSVLPGTRVVRAGTAELPAPVIVAADAELVARPIVRGRPADIDPMAVSLADAGYVEGDALTLAGRVADVLVCAGRGIPYEVVRRAVAVIPGVIDVGVVSAAPLRLPDDLIVAVVADGRLDVAPLAGNVARELAWPPLIERLRFIQLPELPHTAMGMLDRTEVLRSYAAARAA